MGCGCAGSTNRRQQARDAAAARPAPTADQAGGGLGPGYFWTGKRGKAAAPPPQQPSPTQPAA